MNISRIGIFILLLTIISQCHKMSRFSTEGVLKPQVLKPYMFKTLITGQLNIMLPYRQNMTAKGDIIYQEYQIEMVKTRQQILPKQLFNQTTIYAYGGQTKTGYQAAFPGPAIYATINRPIRIKWENKIPGPHILPVDLNYPFKSEQAFIKEVPVVPHAHGVATNTSSDGQPEAYWTMSGLKTSAFRTEEKCAANQAVYYYPNEQQASNNWYHDHAIGITRLNVYAGLAGIYKISDPQSKEEKQLVEKYGKEVAQNETKFLVITDKTFKSNGQLFYPADTQNPSFSSWVPEFFGNTMLVNGVLWPVMKLKKGKHRFMLLNACQNRYLNVYFENNGKKIPIEMVRVDGDYYETQVVVKEIFATLATRFEFILDLSYVTGEIIIKNNAAAPYPEGDPSNLDEFTSQIMKINVLDNYYMLRHNTDDTVSDNDERIKVNYDENKRLVMTQQSNYPLFEEGEKVFSTLFEVANQNGDVDAMFIDGISMINGMTCPNSTYEIGKTYDFYIINLTPDTHPIHFHLINMQKVKQFPFNVQQYKQDYFNLNDGAPSKHGFAKAPLSLDPEKYRMGDDQYPKEFEKVFRDTIDAHPEYVTVLRVKFAKNDGTLFKSFDMKGLRYVFHCHMLQHEDNQMMKYFCLK